MGLKICLDFDIGDKVWVIGDGVAEQVTVEDIEVLVQIKGRKRRGRPCNAEYVQSWAIGTTKEQIEELIEVRCG